MGLNRMKSISLQQLDDEDDQWYGMVNQQYQIQPQQQLINEPPEQRSLQVAIFTRQPSINSKWRLASKHFMGRNSNNITQSIQSNYNDITQNINNDEMPQSILETQPNNPRDQITPQQHAAGEAIAYVYYTFSLENGSPFSTFLPYHLLKNRIRSMFLEKL